jgi:hypothetical protein
MRKAAEDWSTTLNITDIDRAELVKDASHMCVNGFYIVGPSPAAGSVLFYTKCSGVDKERYPDGIFMRTDGDPTYYNATAVFAQAGVHVWSFWPQAMTLRGDPR